MRVDARRGLNICVIPPSCPLCVPKTVLFFLGGREAAVNKGRLSICSPVPRAMCQPQIISASAVARLQSPLVLAAPDFQDNMGTASASATSRAASL